MAQRNCPTIERTGELITERYQTGSANFIGSKVVSVTFSVPFTNTPRVLAMPLADPLQRFWVSAKSTTGFTLELTASATLSFDWFAVQNL